MSLDAFWEHIDNQIEELRSAKTADEVLRICPKIPGTSSGDGFFGGGGGDVLPNDPLSEAGWEYVWVDAHYFWCMQAPNGDMVTYVEGDLYRGNQHPSKADR